ENQISAIEDEVNLVETAPLGSSPARYYRLTLVVLQPVVPCAGLANLPSSALTLLGVSNALMLAGHATSSSGCILRLDYLVNGVLIGQTAPDFPFSWTPLATGDYSVSVRAVDNYGLATMSAPIHVTVVRPPAITSVNIASQAN